MSTKHSRRRTFSLPGRLVALVGMLLVLSGCTGMFPESREFGEVKGVDAMRSLNGLGIFQKMWESKGAKCLYPQKLSPRLETMDAILLVGNTFSPPGKEARDWLEEWLAQKKGRTVIYFGRDFNAEIYYRRETLGQLSLPDQVLGRARLAQSEAAELNQRLGSFTESTFCGWFYLDVNSPSRSFQSFQGDWAPDSAVATGSTNAGEWPVSVTLRPPAGKYEKQKPSWLTAPAGTQMKGVPGFVPGNRSIIVSRWWQQELDSDEAWKAEFENLAESEVLLESDDGTPLVFVLRDSNFPDSQIVVLANGAPLLNGSIVQPLHQSIALQLIEQVDSAKRIAVLQYDDRGITISVAPEKEPQGGLEFLMVWPISAVTMPAALLCILGCAALWPILGRPRKNLPRRVSDFGLHIEALGKILHDSQDLAYVKEVVGQYFHRVRDEKPPVWLETLGQSVDESQALRPPAAQSTTRGATPVGADISTTSAEELFDFNSASPQADPEESDKPPPPSPT